MISTDSNKQIRQVIKLKKSSRERKRTGLFVAEGLRTFREIPEEQRAKVFVSSDFLKLHGEELKGIPFEEVSPKVFREISDTETPQGISSLVKMKQSTLSEILKRSGSSILLLENLQDPGSLPGDADSDGRRSRCERHHHEQGILWISIILKS